MSETLNTPWIADYLINIAETYGTNITNVPVHIKPGKRVQLLQVRLIPRGILLLARILTLITLLVPHFSRSHRGRLCLGLYL